MKYLQRLNLLIVFIFLFAFQIFAQSKFERLAKHYSCANENEDAVLQYFADYEQQEKQIADFLKKSREYQIANFGRILPQISGRCEFGNKGCPISLVKPFYSSEAKRLKIFGQQKVETIIDEKGNVIYARVQNGLPFLSQTSHLAACRSRFTPQLFDNKPFKYRATIVYNFVLN